MCRPTLEPTLERYESIQYTRCIGFIKMNPFNIIIAVIMLGAFVYDLYVGNYWRSVIQIGGSVVNVGLAFIGG